MVQLDQAGRGMDCITIVPARGCAAAAIEFFWLHQVPPPVATQTGRTTTGYRIVPDGSAHLIFHAYRHDHRIRGRLSVVGARSTFTDIDLSARTFTLGARLRPGALRALTRVPAPELLDLAVPFRTLEPESADAFMETLCLAVSPRYAFRAFRRTVSGLVRDYRPDPFDVRAVRELGQRAARVRTASTLLDTSPRRLRQQFRRSTGLSPMRFVRVNRLFHALSEALPRNDPNWAGIAASCGYYDQSHMIHDFTELLGESPERFRGRRDV